MNMFRQCENNKDIPFRRRLVHSLATTGMLNSDLSVSLFSSCVGVSDLFLTVLWSCLNSLSLFSLQLGHRQDLPAEVTSDYEKNEEFLKKVHRVLLEVRPVTLASVQPKLDFSVNIEPNKEVRFIPVTVVLTGI